jgi:uncharacterized protein YjbJ (UPF0337 family)
MNKDKAGGLLDEAKGRAKEITGKLVGNKTLELKGKIQNISGTAQAAYGDIREKLKKAGDNK